MTIVVDPSCSDEIDPASITADEARRRILSSITPLDGFERLSLRAALGRILGQDVRAPMSVPGHDNSAVDGYALSGSELPETGVRDFTIVGSSFAGRPFAGRAEAGQCVRIMTGAVMPEGTDTVVMQEHVKQVSGSRIRIDGRHRRKQNTRAAGEDIADGDTVLSRGRRITPADLGLLASLGINEISVTPRPRVAFLSTGDELRSLGEPLAPGEIYDSNRYTLYGMLTQLGVEVVDMGVVRDTAEATLAAFRRAAAHAHVLITSGGVSVGEADYIKGGLVELGRLVFQKVAMKPGRPLTFGRVDDTWFFGLPGNPVAVMATFYLFVQPALRHLMGETAVDPLILKARCETALKKKPGRAEYQRGIVVAGPDGELSVRRSGPQGSGILTSMSQANCFIVIGPEQESVEAGSWVSVIPFSELRV